MLSYLEFEQVPVKEVNVTRIVDDGDHSKASFVVSAGHIYGWEQIKEGMKEKVGFDIIFDNDLATVSLIGEGLNRNNQTLLETIDLLKRHDISVSGVTTTSFRISLLVPRDQIAESVRLCHARWVLNGLG